MDIPHGVAARVAQIAREFPALVFDAQDPNRTAIEQAAQNAGVAAVPSDTITPRTMRGAYNSGPDPHDAAVLAFVLHAVVCLRSPGTAHTIDRATATAVIEELGRRGWRLVRDTTTTGARR